MSSRVLRSRSRPQEDEAPTAAPVATAGSFYQIKTPFTKQQQLLPNTLSLNVTGFSRADLNTLKLKRQRLRSPNSQTALFIAGLSPDSTAAVNLSAATRATLIYAGHGSWTAVSISPSGLLLTCAHCVADTEAEYEARSPHWLIFSSGQTVKAECVAWDATRDLALLQIIAADGNGDAKFPFVTVAPEAPRKASLELLCIGAPGAEDYEAPPLADGALKATNFDVLHVSSGRYRGLASGQDVQDNSEIGALMHDCWTYWGHSGAPLIVAKTGELIGLHSSWDDVTGMRRGVAWEALQAFLMEWCVVVVAS